MAPSLRVSVRTEVAERRGMPDPCEPGTVVAPASVGRDRTLTTTTRIMSTLPSVPGFDHTLPLLREGYDFLPNRFRRLDTDALIVRLRLEETVCVRGAEGAQLFYDRDRFRRRDAAPRRVRKTLFGEGGVQGLDGEAHRRRKAMFMSVMDDGSIDRLVAAFREHWRAALPRWTDQGRVALLPASREVLTRAVCEWAGVPLREPEAGHRASQLGRLVDAAGGVGPRYLKGRLARMRANAWIEGVVEGIRNWTLNVPEGSPARVVAWYREDGELLPPRVAAVELLNLLRPTVAIDRYITFAALALHEHADGLAAQDPGMDWSDPRDVESFVHEVRRYYPFFPFLAARVDTPFEWRGHEFDEGRQVLLDLYGTNHDAAIWDEPGAFRPRRFRDRDISPFTLIPQGGGDHYGNHRCAGEWITIAVMSEAVRLLTGEMRYRVPEQDLTVDHARIPAEPASGLQIDLRPET